MEKTTVQVVSQLPPGDLFPMPGNRPERSGMDPQSITELATSIAAQGIVQPLAVRRRPAGDGYEIVIGERRWTAAKQIKLSTVPCIIRTLTDQQAHEMQIVENLQREGIHPIEEAHAYAELLEQRDHGRPIYTYETLAKKLGKSPAFVYGRLKLLKMPPLATAASRAGKLQPSVALLLSRIIDPRAAHKATLEVLDPAGTGTDQEREARALDPAIDPMSYRAAKEHVQAKYMARLKGAPFSIDDEDILPMHNENNQRAYGGACGDCPFRAGNIPGAETSADVCTQPSCFAKKKAAAFKRDQAKAQADGHTLLKDTEARRMFDPVGQLTDTSYIDLNAAVPGSKKSWETELYDHIPDHLVKARDHAGKIHFLVPVQDAKAALKSAGKPIPAAHLPPDPVSKAELERQAVERAIKLAEATDATNRIFKAVLKKAEASKPTANFWRWLLIHTIDSWSERWAERLGFKDGNDFMRHVAKASPDRCRALLVGALFFNYQTNVDGTPTDGLLEAATFFKVDTRKLRP